MARASNKGYRVLASVQLDILRFAIITRTKFIRTLSTAQAISYRSQS